MEIVKKIKDLRLKWGVSDDVKQELKIIEEFGELCKAIGKNDIAEVKDGIGDLFITMIILEDLVALEENCLDLEKYDDELLYLFSLSQNCVLFSLDYNFIYLIRDFCEENKIDVFKCIEDEYNKVSKRTGKLINGLFVKD
jgi:NTP pyrophosphatase (non-canonical NTP hydrolase)